ncbi:putative Reverse transcriptase [Dirofilaria immitis]|nr:putative Reverse transcriptase [Dirofilaria immitis]
MVSHQYEKTCGVSSRNFYCNIFRISRKEAASDQHVPAYARNFPTFLTRVWLMIIMSLLLFPSTFSSTASGTDMSDEFANCSSFFLVLKNSAVLLLLHCFFASINPTALFVAELINDFVCKVTHAEELTKRWLSPPASSITTIKKRKLLMMGTPVKHNELSRSAVTLSSLSTRPIIIVITIQSVINVSASRCALNTAPLYPTQYPTLVTFGPLDVSSHPRKTRYNFWCPSIQPAKNRLVVLLQEINSLELECPDPNLSLEQQGNLYTTRKHTRMINGLNLFKPSLQQKKRNEEEKAYESITEGEHGLFQIIHEGKEALLTLSKYKREAEQKSELLFKEMGKVQEKLTPSNSTVNLPQLSLPMFTGDPRQWRQFWSSFNADVHSQAIPEIQKLNYLYSCLRGNALEAVSGYDIAPENYEIIRRLLKEKYGDPSTATAILYKELRFIKRDEKEWVRMIEHIERVIRQLEALGEDMEQSSIEHWIEDKLPHWILDKVFEQKEKDAPWTVSKLRDFLLKRVTRCEKVKFCKTPSAHTDIKPTINKTGPKLKYSPGGSSALSMVHSNSKLLSSTGRSIQYSSQPAVAKRPCVFCNQNHWDSECDVYPTTDGRRSRLKLLKKCLICFKDSHFSERCKLRKRCFYCKAFHNSALCRNRKRQPLQTIWFIPMSRMFTKIFERSRKRIVRHSSVTQAIPLKQTSQTELYSYPQRQAKALALFDSGSQLSFISQKLAQQLELTETDKQIIKITPFGVKNPTPYRTISTQLSVQTVDNDVVTLAVNVVDHITNELQVEQELHTGHMLVQTRVGPIIFGTGDISKLCKNNISLQNLVCTVRANINSELENFWRLEAIGIQESPNDNDDEKILERFQRTLIRKKERYHVCWPWRDSTQKLSDNYGLCMGRLKNLITKLQHNSLLQVYHNTIIEQLQTVIIEEVPQNDEVGVIHYLPIKMNVNDMMQYLMKHFVPNEPTARSLCMSSSDGWEMTEEAVEENVEEKSSMNKRKEFQCETYGKMVKNLKSHMLVHTGEKP